jgi:segregation and condensation protein A
LPRRSAPDIVKATTLRSRAFLPSFARIQSPLPFPDNILLAADANTGAVHTEEFDGPLELLLFLVRQHGVDIRTVPIAPITDAYLSQIKMMEAMELDTAGDFLVIAATLCLIKSREMFPRTALLDGEDEDEDPAMLREALALRLLEYERYKEASETLANRPWLGRDVFARPELNLQGADRPVDPGVDAMGLLEIFYEVLQRSAEAPHVHEVERQTVSMEEVADWMIRRLQQGPRELNDLMSGLASAGQRVMAFICTLEMAKLGIISLNQSQHLGPVVLEAQRTPDDTDLMLLLGNAG